MLTNLKKSGDTSKSSSIKTMYLASWNQEIIHYHIEGHTIITHTETGSRGFPKCESEP